MHAFRANFTIESIRNKTEKKFLAIRYKTQAGVAFFSGGFRTSNHSKIRLMCAITGNNQTKYENNNKKKKQKEKNLSIFNGNTWIHRIH